VKRILSVFLFLSIVWQTKAQDLNCTVEVISNNVQATNRQIFDDLKNSITQFLNNRKWVEDKVSPNERIDCNFVIEITKFDIDQFKANLNIQSSRTAYGSDYNTKIFSTLENNVSFKYAQFQALDFQENNYTDDLTSILAFYTYIIIGQDFDTYSLYGGILTTERLWPCVKLHRIEVKAGLPIMGRGTGTGTFSSIISLIPDLNLYVKPCINTISKA
jgi:hypothetical protein